MFSTCFQGGAFDPEWVKEKNMERVKLEALPRERGSRGQLRKIREEGFVPVIVYGLGSDPTLVSVDSVELQRALNTPAGANVLLDLDIKDSGGEKFETVMIRELQRHPIKKDLLLHADLIRISMKDKLEVSVPLHFYGEPAGAKDGGVLQIQLREVTILCLPAEIPEYIDVPVEEMGVGDVLTVGELSLPAEIEMLEDPGEAIASLLIPEEEPVEVEEELEEEVLEDGEAERSEGREE